MIRPLALAAFAVLALSAHAALAGPPSEAQGLWVANGDYISEFQGSALSSSGTPDAHLAFSIKDYLDPLSIAFDHHNNLWITDLGDLQPSDVAIVEVNRADIVSLKDGSVAERRLIRPTGVGIVSKDWVGISFDDAGALFVSNGQQLLKIPRNRLAKSSPSPSVDVSLIGSTFIPEKIRFDASDNLWLAVPGLSQVLRFAPSDRSASGPPEPGLTLNLLSDFFMATDFSFDHSGNLWLAGLTLHGTGPFVDEVAMIPAANLSGTGWISLSPSLTITSAAFGSGPCLGGLDFDHTGNLWVSVVGANAFCTADTQLVEFTPGQLSVGGNLTPSVIIGQNSAKTNIAFPGPIRFGRTVN